MSHSTHQIEVKAVDKTAGAFSSIKSRAAVTGNQIKSMLGGALALAGGYLGFQAIKGGIENLSKLSDIAQKTSTSVDELSRTSTALNALGIQNMSIDNLARSFDYMAKTTGRSGMAGFYQTIAELGKIQDVAQRGQAAMQVFGRSGMELMPLINAADESVNALQTVVDAMPAIPESAAQNGDAVADAMGFASDQMKSIWQQGLGVVCGWFDNQFTGGVREATLAAGNQVEFFVKTATAKIVTWFGKTQEYLKRFGDAIGTFIGAKMNGATFGEAFDMAGEAYDQAVGNYELVAEELERKEEERTERFKRQFEDRKTAIENFAGAYQRAAISIKKRQALDTKKTEAEIKTPQIRNELIMGGNEANRLAMIGPQFQSEAKKQTTILEKIASATEATASNTEKSIAEGESLGVIE